MSEEITKPTHGCPPAPVSERCRQISLFIQILVGLLLSQMGLALLGLSFYVRPYLQRHHIITARQVNSDLFPYGLIAASVVTLVSSMLSVMCGVAMRQRRRSARRAAVKFGYVYLLVELVAAAYLLALPIVFISQVRVFEVAYQRGFTRAMWRYLESQPIKEYLDGVQQAFACCGSQGFSDWFVVDWYPAAQYRKRYKSASKQRARLAQEAYLQKDAYKDAARLLKSFAMSGYGWRDGDGHSEAVARAMDHEFAHGEFVDVLLSIKKQVRFAEVPFSCCDPWSPTWCHQLYVTYPWYNYDPGKRLGIHTVGCTYKVQSFLSSTVTSLVIVLLVTMAVKVVMMILFRFVQTSTANALAVGRHLSPALGYLMPLPGGDGGARASIGGEEEVPLLEEGAADGASEATSADAEDDVGLDETDAETDADTVESMEGETDEVTDVE